jgi:hypothetical protein
VLPEYSIAPLRRVFLVESFSGYRVMSENSVGPLTWDLGPRSPIDPVLGACRNRDRRGRQTPVSSSTDTPTTALASPVTVTMARSTYFSYYTY